MKHTEPQRLLIEKLIAHEIDGEKENSLRAHFEECSICAAYYQSLSKEHETFLRVYPFEELKLSRKAVKTVSWWKRATDFIARPVLVPVYATLLLGVFIAPIVLKNYLSETGTGIQYKGNAALTFAYQRDGSTMPGSIDYRIKSGDKVQVFYTSESNQFVSLLSVDRTGTVSFYHPDQNSEYCSVLTNEGSQIAFPGSIEFDEVESDELVVVVFSDSPIKTSELHRWIKEQFFAKKNLQSLSEILKGKHFLKKNRVQTILLKR